MKSGIGDPPVYATELVRRIAGGALPAPLFPLPMEGTTEIAGLIIETGPAGHAPGAVWIRIGGEDGLLYTGDCSAESILFPHRTPPCAAALVFDASYGIYDEPLEIAAARLLSLSHEPLLLPAPAGGRGLEMGIVLSEAGANVALCPAHVKVASTLMDDGNLGPHEAERLSSFLNNAHRLDRESLARGVMIAAKPNAQGGVAARLAERFAASGEARIVFTGHLAAGTPAQALVQAGKAEFVRWNVHPRLTELATLMESVRPQIAMPAFVERTSRGAEERPPLRNAGGRTEDGMVRDSAFLGNRFKSLEAFTARMASGLAKISRHFPVLIVAH